MSNLVFPWFTDVRIFFAEVLEIWNHTSYECCVLWCISKNRATSYNQTVTEI